MSLSWLEVGARFPTAIVLWDRDVAPTLDWEPRFRTEQVKGEPGCWFDLVLWARDARCWRNKPDGSVYFFCVEGACRCMVWDWEEWISRHEHERREHERFLATLRQNRAADVVRLAQASYALGSPFNVRTIDMEMPFFDEAQNFDIANYRGIGMRYAQTLRDLMSNMRDRYPRHRWPTLRRVLGRNVPP